MAERAMRERRLRMGRGVAEVGALRRVEVGTREAAMSGG